MVQVNVRRKLEFRLKIKRYVAVLLSVTVTVALAFKLVHNYHFYECTSNCQSKESCAREKKRSGQHKLNFKESEFNSKKF